MAVWQPTRRELIATAPLLLGAAALPRPVTAVGNNGLRLFVIGDWGKDGRLYQRHVAGWMNQQALQSGCDLIVSTGDNFYDFGVSSSHDPQWRTSYEDIYSPELRRMPWFPVAGNHDWGGNIWAQLDRTGNAGWHMPWLWYDIPGARFGRPDVHLFFIDTVVWKGKENKVYHRCGQALREPDVARQKAWLADALRASCAPTKLVFGHHPIYAGGLDGGAKWMDDLDATLIAANVTAYICGHKHCLYHIKGDHLDYICSGGGSEERLKDVRGTFHPACMAEGRCAPARMHQFVGRAGFTIVDAGAEAVTYRFVDRDGRVTPPETIRSRGNHNSACSGALPVDPAELRAQARARARTYFPCAALF